jgi:hypothetical protein
MEREESIRQMDEKHQHSLQVSFYCSLYFVWHIILCYTSCLMLVQACIRPIEYNETDAVGACHISIHYK